MAYLPTRRAFLGSVALPLAATGSERSAPRPVTLDLRAPVREAINCVMARMDPAQNYRPWFSIIVARGRPVRLEHAQWDLGDTSGRFLEAFITARNMMPPLPGAELGEQRIRRYLLSLIASDGLVHNPDQHRPDHMFAQGSTLYALVIDYEDRPSPAKRALIERMIDGLNRAAEQHRDYLVFLQVATKISPCSHQAAYQVLPVVRYYELTRYRPALSYAEKLGRWAFYHDPTLSPDGSILKPGWEGHLHAWMDTCTGVLRCARAGGNFDKAEIASRCRKTYEWVRANYTSPFGWVADSVGAKTCETDTITSAIRLALELIREGHLEYWNDVERFVRNQLVENQFHDVDRLRLSSPHLANGLRGCFESWAHPNDLIGVDNGDIEGCCIGGGIRGLFFAWQHAITRSSGALCVNLLLSCIRPELEVASYFPYEGRLDLYLQTARTIFVRRPDWLPYKSVRLDGPPSLHASEESRASYLKLEGAKPGARITLKFDQPEQHRKHIVAGKEYRCLWRGDTVLAIEPRGTRYPIFERQAMQRASAPIESRPLSFTVSAVDL
jgi:hypothetical protein